MTDKTPSQTYQVGHGYCIHDAVAMFNVYLPFLKTRWDDGETKSFTDINGDVRSAFIDDDGVLTITSERVNDKALITLSEYVGGKVSVADGFETTRFVDHVNYKASVVDTGYDTSRLSELRRLAIASEDHTTDDIVDSLKCLKSMKLEAHDDSDGRPIPVTVFLPRGEAVDLYRMYKRSVKSSDVKDGVIHLGNGKIEIDSLYSKAAIDFVKRNPELMTQFAPITLSGHIEMPLIHAVTDRLRVSGYGVNDFIKTFRRQVCDAGDMSPNYLRALQSATLTSTASYAIPVKDIDEMSVLAGCNDTYETIREAIRADVCGSGKIAISPGIVPSQDCILVQPDINDRSNTVFVHIGRILPDGVEHEDDRLVMDNGFTPIFVAGPKGGVASVCKALDIAFEDAKLTSDVCENLRKQKAKVRTPEP